MADSSFIYTTYIKTTPEKLWEALTTPEFMKQYWSGCSINTDWKEGSAWQLTFPDGMVADAGKVLEAKPFSRLVLSWQNQFKPEFQEEGFSECRFEIEQVIEAVKLTVTHSINKAESKLIQGVSGGWPLILSSLKSFLEGGGVIDTNCSRQKSKAA
ncbi:ATPase [bacterium]|nr:ATPase [bacterium]